MTTEEKLSKLSALLGAGSRLSVLADNGLNRLTIETARLHATSLQIRSRGVWHFIGTRVPVFAGTETRIW